MSTRKPYFVAPRDAAVAALYSGCRPPSGGTTGYGGARNVPLNVPVSPSSPRIDTNTGLRSSPVHLTGGQAVNQLVNPQLLTIAEELYRKLPEESFFAPDVNFRNPIQFEIGSYRVPDGLSLWLMDYEFSVYIPSGLDAGDIIRAADTRFSGFMGWDITLNGRRLSHLKYELDPGPIILERWASAKGPGQQAFNLAASNSFASTASPGLSLLPVRNQVQGARNVPFTLIVEESVNLGLSCVIFRTVTTPIAAIEAKWGGFLLQEQTSQKLVDQLRPR